MEENKQVNTETESGISLMDIISAIRQNLLIVIIICAVSFTCSAVYTQFVQKPTYTAQTSLAVYANSATSTDTMTANAKMQFAIYMSKTYSVFIQTPKVIKDVKEKVQPKKSFTLQVVTVTDTFIIRIIVKSTDKEEARLLANKILELGNEQARLTFTDGDFIEIDSNITPNDVTATKYTTRNLAIGLALGVVLSAAYILLKMMLENTFTKIDDVEHYLGLRVLAAVPHVDLENYSSSKNK